MRLPRWADLTAKVLLVALLASAVLWPDLSGIKGKASTARLVVYPVGALVVPVWWFLYGRRRAGRQLRAGSASYPWTPDLLITLPWVLDLAGNRLNLFDTVTWWDDLMHFVNWFLLTAGALWAWRAPGAAPRGGSAGATPGRGLTVMVALGFGVTAAVAWELGEYVAFVRKSPELTTAYTDTLGDLSLGALGALLAGLVVGQLLQGRMAAAVEPATGVPPDDLQRPRGRREPGK